MRVAPLLVVVGLAVASSLACKKDAPAPSAASASASASSATASSAPAAKAAALEFKKIPQLGLQIEVPASATVEEAAGAGDVMVMSSDPECTVMVSLVDDMSDGYDDTLGAINKGESGGKLQELTKKSKTDDTWDLEYTAASDIDKSTAYGVNLRVKVDGKLFDCTRVTTTKDAATCAAKACQSLKKL